jgi:phospholipid transport system substrate-binding protein
MRPRTRILPLFAVAVVIFCAGAARAEAQPGAASQFIRTLGDEAIRTLRTPGIALEERESRFRQLLAQGFDMPFIARFVLGQYWRGASAEQQSEYVQVFTEYVLQVYSARLGGYAGETLNVVSERPAGEKDVVVNTRIERPSGPPLEAQWRVRATNDKPHIIDVMVAGVSMAVTQRDEFASVLQRQKVTGLIEMLRARTDKLPAAR